LIRVDVEVGVTLVALMGRRAFRESGLRVGEQAVVEYAPAAAHVFPRA